MRSALYSSSIPLGRYSLCSRSRAVIPDETVGPGHHLTAHSAAARRSPFGVHRSAAPKPASSIRPGTARSRLSREVCEPCCISFCLIRWAVSSRGACHRACSLQPHTYQRGSRVGVLKNYCNHLIVNDFSVPFPIAVPCGIADLLRVSRIAKCNGDGAFSATANHPNTKKAPGSSPGPSSREERPRRAPARMVHSPSPVLASFDPQWPVLHKEYGFVQRFHAHSAINVFELRIALVGVRASCPGPTCLPRSAHHFPRHLMVTHVRRARRRCGLLRSSRIRATSTSTFKTTLVIAGTARISSWPTRTDCGPLSVLISEIATTDRKLLPDKPRY
jgi:hypothetical protein